MKRTILSIALTSILAACGSASESQAPVQVAQQATPEAQQPASTDLPPTTLPAAVEQAPEVKPEPLPEPEAPKIDPAASHSFNDPVADTEPLPFTAPKAEEEPVLDRDLKYLNMGVARAIVEYQMVGEALKAELVAEMGEGVDAWIKKDVERCHAETVESFRSYADWKAADAKAMCTGLAYGYWALVNGTSGTEGTPRQCLEKGYCGFMFKQYSLTTDLPFGLTSGFDGQE